MHLWVVQYVYNICAGKVVVRGEMRFVLRRGTILCDDFLLATNHVLLSSLGLRFTSVPADWKEVSE